MKLKHVSSKYLDIIRMSRKAAEKARFVGLIRGMRLPGAKVKNLEKRGCRKSPKPQAQNRYLALAKKCLLTTPSLLSVPRDSKACRARRYNTRLASVVYDGSIRCRGLFQVLRELRLLQRTKPNAGVDLVFGILEWPLGTWKVLRCEELLGIIARLLVAEESCEPWKSSAEPRASLRQEGLEVGLEQLPCRGLCLVVRQRANQELNGGDESPVGGDVAVGHAGGVEGEAGIAGAVEEDEAAGGVSPLGEKMHGFARGEIGGGGIAGRGDW